MPIIAFGSHVEVATLQAARKAGADHAWARSKLMEELVAVVDRHLHPPVSYPEGWEDPLSDLARAGVDLFNAGEYFEQHELLEQAWLAEPRPIRELYQGILQVGVAFLQIQRHNWPGAIKMFRRGLPRLRTLPPICQGLRIGEFRAAADNPCRSDGAGGRAVGGVRSAAAAINWVRRVCSLTLTLARGHGTL